MIYSPPSLLLALLLVQPCIFRSIAPAMAMASSSSTDSTTTTTTTTNPLSSSYEYARFIRTKFGHHVAQPLYRDILLQQQQQQQYNKIKNENDADDDNDKNQQHPQHIDLSAASRIASSLFSPQRHDLACPTNNHSSIKQLQNILKLSRYNKHCINKIFGISEKSPYYYSAGPIYIKPIVAGGKKCFVLPLELEKKKEGEEEDDWEVSLKCLITLFLLGFAVPKSILSESLIGGEETIQLLQNLGLVFIDDDEIDSDLIVPYVSLFPMDVDVVAVDENNEINQQESIVLVTDWHPSVLSRTTVGGGREVEEDEDGAVMYIGPDSLSLVRNLPLSTYLNQRKNLEKSTERSECGIPSDNDEHGVSSSSTTKQSEQNYSNNNKEQNTIHILDFCTGSGIQAISTLVSLSKICPNSTATCVDVNERALRFVAFNALLNGLDCNQVKTVKADLISGRCLPMSSESNDKGMGVEVQALISTTMKAGEERESNNELIDALLSKSGCVDDHNGMKQKQRFDIILANPPFIPVPPQMPIQNENEILAQQQTIDVGKVEPLKHTKEAITKKSDNKSSISSYSSSSSDITKGVHHSIAQRYGLFSSGGPDGEDVLHAIIGLSSDLLRKDGGLLAIVSEFMNPPLAETTVTTDANNVGDGSALTSATDDSGSKDFSMNDNLCHRMEQWWEEENKDENEPVRALSSSSLASPGFAFAKGILFTNEHPISATTYATRRADDKTEYTIWENHLEEMNITHVSPGLLFVHTDERRDEQKVSSEDLGAHGLSLHHVLVPKCQTGSIWTPHNQNAVAFTRDRWSRFMET